MITGAKILVTGASGQVAFPIAAWLARQNEVWGGARFLEETSRAPLEAAGITPIAIDLAAGDFDDVPDDFDYLLHFGFTRGGADQFDHAMRVNGEGTGLILQHCRRAKAALVISSAAIYAPNPDPWFAHAEAGELGRAYAPWSPTSPVTKVAMEATARFAARAFDLPVTIARLNTVYGSAANLPSMHIRQLVAGDRIVLPCDPNNHSPIHVHDMCAQVEPLLAAAATRATIVNWAGDEIVSAQRWCAEAGALLGTVPDIAIQGGPGVAPSNIADVTRRLSITGPCSVSFADGLARLVADHHRG
jgi:nucleoside-diphosphate-sugar epimerase